MKSIRGYKERLSGENFTEKLASYYDYYVSVYNKRQDALSFLGDMTSTKEYLLKEYKNFFRRGDELKVEFVELLDDLYKEPPSSIYIEDGKIISPKMNNEKFEENIKFHLKYRILEKVGNSQLTHKFFREMVNALYDYCNITSSIWNFKRPIHEAIECYYKGEEVGINLRATIKVMEKVVIEGYPEDLDKYNNLSLEEKEELHEGSGNNDKLNKSVKWMSQLLDKLNDCTSEEQMIQVFREFDEDYRKPDPNKVLYFDISERINNKQVALSLMELHNKRVGPKYQVKIDALYKRFPEKLSMN